jgi:hypothetical protein
MGSKPVDRLLVGERFGIGVGTGAEHGGKQMRWFGFAAGPAVNRDRRSGPIDKGLLACLVFLAENDVLGAEPALVKIAEPAVPVAIRVGFFVFFPEQLPGDVFALLALLVEHREVWQGTFRFACDNWLAAEQRGVQLLVIPAFR